MFKRKADWSDKNTLHQLGIDRRLALRVKYPSPAGARLPKVYYSQPPIQVLDLSIGGCCLFTVHGQSILAEITLQGATYTLYRDAWPTKGPQFRLSPIEISELALFVHNIPQPSEWVRSVSTDLSLLLPEARE